MSCTRWKLVLTLVMLAAVGCGLGVYDNFAPLRLTDNFHVIEPGRAYRSAQVDAETLALLIDLLEIRTVVNLRGENASEPWYDNEKAVADASGAELVDVRMSASELPPRAELLRLYDTFLTAEEPLLIHCQAGADRTGAAAAVWRIVMLGASNAEAAEELCICFGHFETVHPAMDELVRIFQPDRAWIEEDYPVP